MVRKTHNLLTKGLTSELFLLAFLEPDNIRKLAQKLQDTTGNPTNYSKASPAIHNLTSGGYLKHKDDGKFYPNITKLAYEVNEILKNKDEFLSEDELKLLEKFLQHRDFFRFVSQDTIRKMKEQPKSKHAINAIEICCEIIGSMASSAIVYRKTNPKSIAFIDEVDKMSSQEVEERLTGLDTVWNKIMTDIETNFENITEFKDLPHKEKLLPIVLGIFKSIPGSAILFTAPETLLNKLAKLWVGHDGVVMTLHLLDVDKK